MVSLSVGTGNADIRGTVNYMAMKGEEVVGPEEIPFRFAIDQSGKLVSRQAGLQESSVAAAGLKRKSVNLDQPVKACGGTGVEDGQSKGLLSIFILGFLGGLIALLTPCVFPMIPLTVSFFTKIAEQEQRHI